jgi:hypothetical protein
MIKNLVIAVLLVVVVLFLFSEPTYNKGSVTIVRDTVYQQKTFTKYKKGKDIHSYTILTDSVQIPVQFTVHDTIEVLTDYMRKYAYSDTIKIDSNNIVFIQDTISQNKILGRGFSAKLSEKTIIETRTITPKVKNALYLGVTSDFRQDKTIDNLGVGLIYKVKNKALIGLNLKTGQSVKYGVGFYLKL